MSPRPPFARVLVANRGEIACRIIRTLHELGCEAVAVYSDADRGAAHVAQADHAVRLGPAPADESYLRADRILEAAATCGAEAVHPGYGFLSERADFAEAVEAAGLAFVGPTTTQLRDFGDKHRARQLARAAGVALLPGTGLLPDAAAALAAAESVGYPVMLKSAAGGGGIGLRACHGPDELAAAFDQVTHHARANFGSADVFLERFVARARHVEVQVFGDGDGGVVLLGERDCSVQRRNQKVIEETPAPGLPAATREALRADAWALAAAVRYRSAGTVELLVDADTGEHFFLEVNTRLQVEHGVTELTHGVDLVAWMVRLAAGDRSMFGAGAAGTGAGGDGAVPRDPVGPGDLVGPVGPVARGHAVEARVYAESPAHGFQPSPGRLTHVRIPEGVRCDGWVEPGTEVTPYYDPLLLKLLAHGPDRATAVARLDRALAELQLAGIETNVEHLRAILADPRFAAGEATTGLLADLPFTPPAVEVVDAGAGRGGQALVVAHPGRTGYWSVGVPPSGPMDDWSFRLGNALLGNPADAAGLELSVAGPTLRFHRPATVCLTGADMGATLDTGPADAGCAGGAGDARGDGPGGRVEPWVPVDVPAGAVLRLGAIEGAGARAYLLVRGGLAVPEVLGSRTTFDLGGFGGLAGRALQPGDLLRIDPEPAAPVVAGGLPPALRPELTDRWVLAVLDGPHAAPDYLTAADVDLLYGTDWEVHYNSARTGVRLVGPRLSWARPDGGDAGLHPSNVHDNAYAVGTVDFTGDMPVILGPDGPSLGGFVCPATVVDADLWKIGQLRAGDRVRLLPVSAQAAADARTAQAEVLSALAAGSTPASLRSLPALPAWRPRPGPAVTVLGRTEPVPEASRPPLTFRRSGDRHLLVEVGLPVLDLDLRVRVHQLATWFADEQVAGVTDLTPGIRSLQVQVDGDRLDVEKAMDLVRRADAELPPVDDVVLPSRVVHLPLSWDDPAVRTAIDIYMRSVRPDAPWCPSNLEFIRRVNGLASIDEVRRIAFAAEYVVYGLGDVYLGAPVATPLDPRHRLVTTKYNPARTWTPENAVGIGGAYLCVYGMEGPGGYQFIGRTTQVWHRWPAPGTEPWLLRCFDRLRFHAVDADELLELRADCAAGRWAPEITDGTLSIAEHHRFLDATADAIAGFRDRQQAAFGAERERWAASGELATADAIERELLAAPAAGPEVEVPEGAWAVTAPLAARVWAVPVREGDRVAAGDPVVVLEAMKTETVLRAPGAAAVVRVCCEPGELVAPGRVLAVVMPS
ncbi:MAG TPA: urea carboxylase [Acidimicrobiales bacterium]